MTEQTYKVVIADKKAGIALLYKNYGKKLYSYAIQKWKVSEDDAWDLIYKTIYKVCDSSASYQFESEEKYASFIFKVFINYLRNHFRDSKKDQQKVVEHDLSNVDYPLEDINHEIVDNIKLLALNEELEKMEDWERMLLLLRSDGMSYAEITRFIDKPESQLKVYYQRLKERISKRLHERL